MRGKRYAQHDDFNNESANTKPILVSFYPIPLKKQTM